MAGLPPLHPDRAYFIDEVAAYTRTSRRTIERLRSHNNFPIPELPALDKRPRWSGAEIQKFLEGQSRPVRGLRRAS